MVTRTLTFGAVLAAILSTAVGGASTITTANASATSRGLVVGGSRFFPVMLIDQCTASDTANARALGVNLVVNESCPGVAPSAQLALLRPDSFAVLPIGARATRGGRLIGWTYPDEPDNNGWTPASLAKAEPYRRGNADGLVTLVTTTGRFFRQTPYGATQVPLARYAGFARLADMAGFDLYPLNACQADLTAVYNAQAQSAAQFIPRMREIGLKHFRVEMLRETPEEVGRASAHQARLERLIVAAGGVAGPGSIGRQPVSA